MEEIIENVANSSTGRTKNELKQLIEEVHNKLNNAKISPEVLNYLNLDIILSQNIDPSTESEVYKTLTSFEVDLENHTAKFYDYISKHNIEVICDTNEKYTKRIDSNVDQRTGSYLVEYAYDHAEAIFSDIRNNYIARKISSISPDGTGYVSINKENLEHYTGTYLDDTTGCKIAYEQTRIVNPNLKFKYTNKFGKSIEGKGIVIITDRTRNTFTGETTKRQDIYKSAGWEPIQSEEYRNGKLVRKTLRG